ncbi:MAG: DMT family transporter [Patescibacteria group bacterium]
MTKKSEKIATIQIFLVAILWGMFPIVVNKGSQHIQPIFFAASSVLLSCITIFIISLFKKSLKELKNKRGWKLGIIVAITGTAIPEALLFIGSQLTSGINTAALLLSEIIFTLLIMPFLGERPTLYKTLSGLLVLAGAFMILFKSSPDGINIGDILIFLSTMTFPFGNYFSKKILNEISAETLMIIRYSVGGIFLLALSFITEDSSLFLASAKEYWIYIFINGIVLSAFTNTIWYKGLKHLEVSKAISILMTFPLFSLIFLIIFFKEIPSPYQLIGLIVITIGGICSSLLKKSTPPNS